MYTPKHVLADESIEQGHNVFICCHQIAMRWHVDNDWPVRISTAYRWITTVLETERQPIPHSFILLPVVIEPTGIFAYDIQKGENSSPLSRESDESIPPGDYGMFNKDGSQMKAYYTFSPTLSYADWGIFYSENNVAFAKKASLPDSIASRTLARDKGCIFTGVSLPTGDSKVTWIFPPFLGYEISDDLDQEEYYEDSDATDMGSHMVVENTVSGRRDVVQLFEENRLGVDVDDNYRIFVFNGLARIPQGATPLKSHVTFVDGCDRPSDRYLRLHFQRCLTVNICANEKHMDGYLTEDIEELMEQLGVFENTMDMSDSRWSSRVGREIKADLIREKILE